MNAACGHQRRRFLKGSAAVGLLISFYLPITRLTGAAESEEFVPNAFLRIAPDNTVTAISKHIEFGQGTYTGIATVLANELDAAWSQIRVELPRPTCAAMSTWLIGPSRAPAALTRWRIRGISYVRLVRKRELSLSLPLPNSGQSRQTRSRLSGAS